MLALIATCGGPGPGQAGKGEAGPVCDAPAIVGEVIPELEGPGDCGIARPVRVYSIAGVALDPRPTITCGAARALRAWIVTGAKPAVRRIGERLAGLRIAAGYICRNVNRAEEGELSEHAYGRAIDISGFRLQSGETLSVAEHWDSERYGRALRRMYLAGCGPFGTALGPGSDAFHEDHFHFDVAQRRRPYCPSKS
jgi:hypothetical protein